MYFLFFLYEMTHSADMINS